MSVKAAAQRILERKQARNSDATSPASARNSGATGHGDSSTASLVENDALRDRLQHVVTQLVHDCLDWYNEDMDLLAVLSDEDLYRTVLSFLAQRDWYMRDISNHES